MGYLLAAIAGWSSLIILLKLFERKRVDLYVGITVNYFVGAVLAFLFAPQRMPVGEIVQAPWFGMAMAVGAVFMLAFMIYGLSAQRSGVAVTTLAGRSAMVIPVLFAFLVLDERVTLLKIIMLLLVIVAMILILYKKADVEPGTQGSASLTDTLAGKRTLWIWLLPVAVFLFNGTSDTMVQYAQKVTLNDYAASQDLPAFRFIPLFMGTMFLASTATGVVCYAVRSVKQRYVPTVRDLGWGALLGFMNWVCMVGVLNGLNQLDGSLFYPLYYTGTIVVSTAVGVWFFRERLTRLNYLGIVLAVIAIAVLSMQ